MNYNNINQVIKEGEMKVNIKLDQNIKEAFVEIYTSEINNDINDIVSYIEKSTTKNILCTEDDKIYLINPNEINFFYSENQNIFANTDKGIFKVKHKLYQLEEKLSHLSFIRISKSAIANLSKVNHFEMSFGGTVTVIFQNNSKEYVSRRYVNKIKEYLSNGGI